MEHIMLQGAWGSTLVAAFIPFSAIVGILFAIYQFSIVKKVTVGVAPKTEGGYRALEDGGGDDEVMQSVADIQNAISEGESKLYTSTPGSLAPHSIYFPLYCTNSSLYQLYF